jgi:hypothetical protein
MYTEPNLYKSAYCARWEIKLAQLPIRIDIRDIDQDTITVFFLYHFRANMA